MSLRWAFSKFIPSAAQHILAVHCRVAPIAEEGFLREADAGLPVKELCRKHGFSEPSYYAWKAKFGGMNVSDAQRLKALEAENNKLKMSWPPE